MPPITRRASLTALATPALLFLGAAAPARFATIPIDRLDLPWWQRRFHAKQARLRRGADLLLLGDSIFAKLELVGPPAWLDYRPVWQRYFAHRNTVDLGFVGDTTANLLWRLRNGELSAADPKAAVMLIGANNFGRVHWDASATEAGIHANLAEIRHRRPRMRVLLLSVLPSDRGAWVAAQTRAVNAALAARFPHPGREGALPPVSFLDVNQLFLRPDGRIDRGLYIDPLMHPPEPALHPTPTGMARLAHAIAPWLARAV